MKSCFVCSCQITIYGRVGWFFKVPLIKIKLFCFNPKLIHKRSWLCKGKYTSGRRIYKKATFSTVISAHQKSISFKILNTSNNISVNKFTSEFCYFSIHLQPFVSQQLLLMSMMIDITLLENLLSFGPMHLWAWRIAPCHSSREVGFSTSVALAKLMKTKYASFLFISAK